LEPSRLLTENKEWTNGLLFGAACFLLFWNLGDRGLWGSEGRWAEVTREMFLSGDFFHPTIGGEPYFDKPLLTYWLIAGITALTGILNEWVVRLPSAMAGLVGLWATVRLGERLWSAQTGRIAGWILLTSYGFLFWSRTAAAETENMAAIIVCVLWYWYRREHLGFTTFLILYLIAFVGAMNKGLTAVVVPMVAIVPDYLEAGHWKNLLRPGHFLALGIGAVVYLSPFFYAHLTRPEGYQSSGLALVFQENILRYFNPIDHQNPFYIYLYSVPKLILPWAPLFIVAMVGTFRNWKKLDDHTRWLLKAIVLIFLFFTASGSRRSYYILPILPFCALVTSAFIIHLKESWADKFQRVGMNIQKILLMGLIVAELMVPVVFMILKSAKGFPLSFSLNIISLVTGGTALLTGLVVYKYNVLTRLCPENRLLISLIAIAGITLGGFFCWQNNILDGFRTERAFAQELQSQLADVPPERIGFYPKSDAKMLFYLGKDKSAQSVKTAPQWQCFLAGEPPWVVIAQRRYAKKILSGKPDWVEKANPWESASSQEKKWAAWKLQSASQVGLTPAAEETSQDEK
jgi:4-amino-4-deoxy-L-arabinose transferase-like glycosyltransferase